MVMWLLASEAWLELTASERRMYHQRACRVRAALSPPNYSNMANILEQIEYKYPVEQITVNGEQVWPYLRIWYYGAHRTKTVGLHGEAKYESQASTRSRPGRIIRFAASTLRSLRYGFRNWFRRYDYIVLAGSRAPKKVGGGYMNPLLDPIIAEIGPTRSLCVRPASYFGREGMKQIYTRHVVSWSLVTLFSLTIILLRRMFFRRHKVTNGWLLDRIAADFGLNIDAAVMIENCEAERKAFTWLFRMIRPRAVLLTCYYGKEPAIRAAKSLGIKVIEVQHGVIGREHPAYNVHREMDRSCFPDHLLVFGSRELETFDNSRFIDPANVHPVGSYYIDYIRDNYSPEPQLRDQLSGYKRVVGVTLQWTSEKRLIAFVCEAAKLDMSIMYMLIPRQPEKEEYSNMVLPRNVAVIRDKSFYELMAYCDFHSTVNSTCALEAPALGVQNVLIDLDGMARAYYEKILSDERVTRFAETAEEYVEIVRTFTRLDREAVCRLHEGFFASNYQENVRSFVKTYLP